MSTTPEMPQGAGEKVGASIFRIVRKVVRKLENFLFLLVLLVIAVYFILQSPPVQNYLVRKVATFLSEELQTTVQVDRVDIALFDNLVLEGLYIEDQQGDTLLYAADFRAGLSANIISVFRNRLELDEIRLSRARFNLRTREGETVSNLQFLIDYFSRAEHRDKTPKPFALRVSNLWLNNVSFLSEHVPKGKYMFASLDKGNVRIQLLDWVRRKITVQSAAFDGLDLHIADRQPVPGKQPAGEEPEARKISLNVDSLLTPPQLEVNIGRISIGDSRFRLDKFKASAKKPAQEEVIDFNHLNLRDIAFQANNIYFNDDLFFRGELLHLAGKERCGISIEHVGAREVIISDTLAALYGTRIETAGTSIGDTVTFRYNSYRDFLRFEDKVRMDGRIATGSRLRIGDLLHFSPALANNPFFINNREGIAQIEGHVYGSVNRLNGRELKIGLGDNTFLHGKFDGDDLAEGPDRMRLQFDFEQLQSNMRTIRSIIPGFQAPAYFNQLGDIRFSGYYKILFGFNHILDGKIYTDVGYGDLDIELDLTGGREKATYSGELDMKSFDLARWSGNPDFGPSTFRFTIAEGSTGLTLPTIRAKLSGGIDSIQYKGYRYRNLQMNGSFNEYVFNGTLGIEDPNIAFNFDGTVNLKDSIPVYDFSADLRRLNTRALNLTEQDLQISGKISSLRLQMRTLNDLQGQAEVNDIRIVQDQKLQHQIGKISFRSGFSINGNRQFVILSDVADCMLEGNFNPLQVSDHIVQMLGRQHPQFAQKLGMERNDSLVINDFISLNLHIKDTRDLTRLILPQLDTLRDVSLLGRMEGARGFLDLTLSLPRIRYGTLELNRVDFSWNSLPGKLNFDLLVPESRIGKGPALEPFSLLGSATRDQLGFAFKTMGKDSNSYIRNLNLNGALSVIDSLWQIRFSASDLSLFNEQWYIEEDNFVRFDRNYFAARNFELGNDYNQRIRIDSLNNGRGLDLVLTNFDLKFLNKIVRSKDTTMYRGKIYDLEFMVQDVFEMSDLSFYLTTDTLFIRDQPYGNITGNLEMKNLNSPLGGKIFINDPAFQLRVAGAWLPGGGHEQDFGEFKALQPGTFQTNVTSNLFPLHILQQFIPGISKTAGQIDAQVWLGGPFDKVGMKGNAVIKQGQFQVDYLKSLFYIRDQPLQLSSTQIWADGDTLWDASNKSMAVIKGGLRHDHFRNISMDCSIETLGDNFMALNTAKGDNELFYGQGIGKFRVSFAGTFARPDMFIDATTGRNTRLFIPLSSTSDAKEVNFITYRDKSGAIDEKSTKRFRKSELKGLNFGMNLSVTEDAEVQLIFDEESGDIVEGRGAGDLSFYINREGEFKMYGNYTIREGNYLFTLLNLVNKPFTVEDGGVISWYGDPYGAQIRLDATYDENTPVYNFISDELLLSNDQNLVNEARKATRVLVTMHLTGDLFKPDISFDLEFPNISSRLKTLTDNKIRLLQLDQNELNRQVFGLVVIGSFLPTTFSASSSILGQAQSSGINTLTQVFTKQFSNYLTGLAAEWFGGKVSSIDFDIAYNEYRNALADPSQPNLSQIGRELQLRFSGGFADDRVTIQVGSQIGLGRPTTPNQNTFLGEDVTVEIQLTENRQWRLKVYQRTEPDFAGGARRSRYGFGLSFRKEYDSFEEMMQGLGGWFKRKS